MSSLLSAELAATCNALGYFDTKTNKYYADGNTLETVKDLIRYLRRDDESHDIRRQLGETKVLQADLLPLLKSYWEETDLFDVLLRLIVNLTTPALMLWNEELPTQKTTRNHYLQIEDHLQYYKEAFADEGIWSVLSTRLSKILEIDYAERGDENSLIIERILILIRNILYVPADPMVEKRTDNDASVHDQVLWALHQSGMMDIILYMTSSANEQAYYMHILEILSFMLREQKASKLASDALQRSQTEKLRDEAELLSIRNRENIEKRKKVKAYVGTRHSRFGGTYQVMSMKSISDNELIYHKPLNKLDALNFDANKKKPKTPKNRLPMQGSSCERRSAFSIRLFLKEFCVEFLNGSYNTMMYHVKDNLSRAKSQAHDESYYLWAIRFFMEFNRCYKFEVKLVSETMSVQTFHYVQQQSENYFDLISTDKKKLRQWSRRLHLALLAYKELFMTLCAMDLSPESDVRDSAKVIKSNVFYVLEYREFILTLLVTYDELKMSDVYLKDLVETQHVFLKMLEAFCKNEGTVVVEKKGRAARREKSKASAPRSRSAPVELNLDAQWDEVSPQLSTVLDGATELTTDVMPFDAASDVPIDEQKSDAMKNIQRKLRSGDYENAIGLLRAAREVWPENDSFGSNNMAPEEEFLALRDIFFADLGENTVATTEQPQDALEEDEYDDENEEEEEEVHRSESDFKFYEFTKRLAHPKVVRACGLALRNFEKNSVNTNHCIVKLLHRIAFDCKMYGMLFQVSIFRTFQRIFAMKEVPECKELVKFAIYIMRQFFKVAEINKKVYMESLFWKSSRTAFDIEQGYGSYQEKSSAGARAWTEQEEDELRRLFMEHQHEHRTEDVVDWIVNNLIDNTKTRRAVLKKLKEMCLLIDYKGSKKSAVTSKIPQNWGAEEETELRELFENFKDAVDPLTCIMDRLTVKRPKNRIIEKLLVMGLIQDKKEMRKKRPPKSSRNTSRRQGNGSDNESLASGSGSDSESEDDTRGSSSQPRTSRNKTNSSSSKKKASGSSRKGALVQVSATQLATQLVDLVEADMSESLEWLKESFTDAIEDFENGDNEGIPLVPIMDYAVSAMENVAFQRLLKALGVVEPFDEQEMYWRISGHLSVQTLKSHCDLIQQALDKTLTVPEEPVQETANHSSSDDEDIFEQIKNKVRQSRLKEKIKKSAGNGKTPHQNGSASSVNDSEDEDAPNSAIKDTITRTNIAHVEDRNNVPEASIINDEPSPSISRIENSDEENAIKEKRKKTIIRKKIAPVDDSEESNDVPEAISQGSSRIDEEGLSRINDKPSKKSRIEDSDEEDATTEKRKKKAITRRKIAPVDDSEDSNDVPETISRVDDEPSINVSTTKISGRIEDSDEEDAVTEKRKSRRILESDDDEDQTESLVLEGEKIPSQARKIVDSDSEDDIDKENLNTVNIATDGDLKRVRSNSASDSDKPRSKRSRVIDSDSDA